MRAPLIALCILAVAAGTAFATTGEKEQIHLTKADQASAKRAVAVRSDLGAGNWTGGYSKPNLSQSPACATFHPRQADLVVTGAAESDWTERGLQLETVAQVLKTRAMVAADWQRTILASGAVPCLRRHLLKELGKDVTFVSFRRVIFAPVATNAQAFLMLVDVKTNTGKVRVAVEFVAVAQGRTELTIVSIVQNAVQKVVSQIDAQIARQLVARAI
ncbi:MAG TPA: hypothetical protein VLJ44_13450 [Gaiellaceae bacterium]|nr:hypothetical protein [Gaiellaceae bacterium]